MQMRVVIAASFPKFNFNLKKPQTLQQWSIKYSTGMTFTKLLFKENNMCLFCGHLWNIFNK